MTFAASTPELIRLGPSEALSIGTYTNDSGTTGGDIAHGLRSVKAVYLNPTGATVTSAHVYNETLPLGSGTAVTIVTGANEGGSFMIYGTL